MSASITQRIAGLEDLIAFLQTDPSPKEVLDRTVGLADQGLQIRVAGTLPIIVFDVERACVRQGPDLGRSKRLYRLFRTIAIDGPRLDGPGLVAAEWQRSFDADGRNALRVAISRLRNRLDDLALHTRPDGGYELRPQPWVVDVTPLPRPSPCRLEPLFGRRDLLDHLGLERPITVTGAPGSGRHRLVAALLGRGAIDAAVGPRARGLPAEQVVRLGGLLPDAATALVRWRAPQLGQRSVEPLLSVGNGLPLALGLVADRAAEEGVQATADALRKARLDDVVTWALAKLDTSEHQALRKAAERGRAGIAPVALGLALAERLWGLGLVDRMAPPQAPRSVQLTVHDVIRRHIAVR
ncbi:MAG: hypothetical protein AAGA48_34360 [Myxococcota bacterium]